MFKKATVLHLVLVLVAGIIIAWQLDLPEGRPRFIAGILIALAGAITVWLSIRANKPNLNNRK